MNKYINKKMKALAPYEPNQPIYKIRLDANESPYAPSKDALKKFEAAISTMDFNRYPDPMATGICEKYAGYLGLDKKNLVAGNGSDELISVISGLFFEQGDKLLITKPDFSMYEFYAKIACVDTIALEKNEDTLSFTIDEIIAAAKKYNPRVIMFSNPCNPTGQGFSKDEILRLVKSVDCICIIDEAYMEFYGDSVVGEVNNFENLVVLRTASKALGLAGIRLGFAISNFEFADQIRKAKSPFNVNSITQLAAFHFFDDREYIRQCIDNIIEEKKYLENKLGEFVSNKNGFKLIKTKTNFALVKTNQANEINHELLSKSICVRCLNGMFLRITAGTREENDAFISEFAKIVNSLK